MKKIYIYKSYNKKFKKQFELERKRIMKILPFDIRIEHFGSTAVEGIGGKGIIDVLLVADKKDIKKIKEKLLEFGYKLFSKQPDKNRISFYKYYGIFLKRRVHIHICSEGSKNISKVLKFRDNLRKNKRLAKEYEKLKKRAVLIAKHNGEKYRKLKSKFIEKYSK